jgi:hypothetical protein
MTNSWSLYKWQPYKDYPSVNYFWVNPDGVIKHTRSVEPLGYLPVFDMSDAVDCNFKEERRNLDALEATNGKVIKVKVKKMTDEQLSQGMLRL